jgi:hypothetical protein
MSPTIKVAFYLNGECISTKLLKFIPVKGDWIKFADARSYCVQFVTHEVGELKSEDINENHTVYILLSNGKL